MDSKPGRREEKSFVPSAALKGVTRCRSCHPRLCSIKSGVDDDDKTTGKPEGEEPEEQETLREYIWKSPVVETCKTNQSRSNKQSSVEEKRVMVLMILNCRRGAERSRVELGPQTGDGAQTSRYMRERRERSQGVRAKRKEVTGSNGRIDSRDSARKNGETNVGLMMAVAKK